jgi:hypothetical protein
MLWAMQNQLRFFLRALLGQQVPQHDVDTICMCLQRSVISTFIPIHHLPRASCDEVHSGKNDRGKTISKISL